MQDTTHSVAPGTRRRRKKQSPTTQVQASQPPPPVAATGAASDTRTRAVQAAAGPQSLALRLWVVMRREPALLVSMAYLFVSFIGLWANYWFFRRFDLPILEYMQGGDYLVAGLRDPIYAYAVIGIALVSVLIVWVEKWRTRHPERVQRLSRHWWGRTLVGKSRLSDGWYMGMSRETGLLVLSFITAMLIVFSYVDARAAGIRAGGGHVVRVSLAGETAPLAGNARLLGTNSSFVFLWWPQQQRVEALPTANVSRIESIVAAPSPGKPARSASRGAAAVAPGGKP